MQCVNFRISTLQNSSINSMGMWGNRYTRGPTKVVTPVNCRDPNKLALADN